MTLSAVPTSLERFRTGVRLGGLALTLFAFAGCTAAKAQPEQAAAASATESTAAKQLVDLTSTRPGEDWPQFLGPRDNGVSGETGLLDQWPDDGPPRLWDRALGEGYASPSVRGERLVIMYRHRDIETVECLHAQTGDTLWKYDYPTDFTDPYGYNGGTRCAPVLSDTRCFTFGPQGKLLCLDLVAGNKVWERDTQQEWNIPPHFFGAGCTPVLDGDRLFVLIGGQPNSAVAALDAATGKTLWESGGKDTWDGAPTDEPGHKQYQWTGSETLVSYSTPLMATIHGQKHLLCLLRQGLASFDPENGKLRFQYWFRSRTHESVNAARPVVVGDLILLTAAYETGAALLRVQPSGDAYQVVWRKPRGLSCHWSTPIVVNGYAYGFSGRHEPEAKLQCVELESAELQWESNGFERDVNELDQDPNTGKIRDKATGKPIPWPFFGRGSMVLADGKFWVLAERGTVALVKPNPDHLEEICRTSFKEIGYPSWGAPVLSRGRLYLRSEKHLVCLDVAKPLAK